jgi:hypothetical protein
MTAEGSTHQVSISFVGAPPAGRVGRASGVSDLEIDGSVIHCLVTGSFQSFLEALHGHEVVTLQSAPVTAPASSPHHEGDH